MTVYGGRRRAAKLEKVKLYCNITTFLLALLLLRMYVLLYSISIAFFDYPSINLFFHFVIFSLRLLLLLLLCFI